MLILPPVDQITDESLAEIGKPIKVYYNSKTTFQEMKMRLIHYLNQQKGSDDTLLKNEDVHLWKPEFKYTIKSNLFRLILE